MGVALALIVVFGALRAGSPNVATLILLTVGLGIGMGMAGAIPSMIIQARARRTPAFMTGMHGTGVVLGAAGASLIVVPLVGAGGGWRQPILLLSILVFGAATLGFLLLGPDGPRAGDAHRRAVLPWSDVTAWQIAGLFGLQSLIYWSLVIWLAEVLVASGWSAIGAATMVGVFQVSNVVAVVGFGFLADRVGTRTAQLRAVGTAFAVGLAGMAILPQLAVPWIVVTGIGLGAGFPLAMTLPIDYARDENDAGAKASLMLLVGYLVAATGPPTVGLIRGAVIGVTPVYLLLAACAFGFVLLSTRLPPPQRDHPQAVPITTD